MLVCTAASLDPRGEKRKKRKKSFFEKTGSTGFVGSALPRVSRSLGFKRAIEETILQCNQCPMIKRGGNVVQQKITTCCSTVQTVFDDEFFFKKKGEKANALYLFRWHLFLFSASAALISDGCISAFCSGRGGAYEGIKLNRWLSSLSFRLPSGPSCRCVCVCVRVAVYVCVCVYLFMYVCVCVCVCVLVIMLK